MKDIFIKNTFVVFTVCSNSQIFLYTFRKKRTVKYSLVNKVYMVIVYLIVYVSLIVYLILLTFFKLATSTHCPTLVQKSCR